MSFLRLYIGKLENISIQNLDVRHKVQIIFGLTSLIPLATYSYVLLRENVTLGTDNWLLVSLSVLLAFFGLELLHATVAEVSERSKLDLRFVQNEEKYSNLFQHSHDAIILHKPNGDIVDANQKMLDVIGYTKSEILQLNISDLHPSESIQKSKLAFEKFQRDRLVSFEIDFKKKNGDIFPGKITSNLFEIGGTKVIQSIVHNIDELRQAEEALEEIEERYRALFDRTLHCVYIHDFEGRFLDANEAALNLFGYKREDITSLDFSSLLDDDKLTRATIALERIKQTGYERTPSEYKLRKKNGDFVWVETESSVIYKDGKPYAIQGVAHDITERKKTEEALREAEERFRTVFENTVIGLYRTTPEGKILMANPALVKMLGYSSFDELKNRNLEKTSFEPEYHRSSFKERIEKEGQVTGIESSWIRRGGTTMFVRESARCTRDTAGNILYYEGTVEDITDHKRTEDALRVEKAYLEQLFESAQEAIVMADNEGKIQRVNSEFVRLFGYDRKEALGKSLDELVSTEDLRDEAESITKKVAKGEKVAHETLRRRKDGTLFDVSILASPISIGNEQVGVYGIYRDITERVRAAGALRESQEKYSNLFQYSNDAIFLHDLEGNIIDVNQKVIDLFQYTKSEILSLTISKLHPPDAFERSKWAFETISKEGFIEFEIDFQKKNREIFPAEVSSSILEISGKKVVQGIVRDITDRKQAEEALQREKAYLEQLFESAQEAIVMADNDGKIMRMNTEFVRLFGYERDEAIGRSIDELIAPKNLHDEAFSITKKVTRGERIALESQRQRKDGTLIDVSVLASPIVVHREQVALYGIYRDITDRKCAEEALRESEEKYRNLIDQSRDAIYLLFNGKFEIINKRFEELFGYNQEETNAPEFNFMNLVAPKSRKLIEERVERVQRGETVLPQYEFTALLRDKSEIEVETSVSYIQYKGGVATQGILRDITERVRAEKALREYATELERSNQELEHFAYVSSHDLQEPLRMVASYLQLLERRYKDKLDSDANDFIAYAVDGAVRMQNLINDLLAYSRVGTRGRPFEPVDCEEILNQALMNLKVAIEESDAVVTRDKLPTVVADVMQLAQVFQNLLGNAIKFRTHMRPEIHVGATSRDNEWVFSVRDNGIGLDPKYAERIFRIFQRLHTRGEYPGTGAGLAICKKIVERHGGKIWVESRPGNGSTFYFTIPMKGDVYHDEANNGQAD